MDEKVIIKLSRKIEYLVHKRHRSFRHIQNAISKEGNFWLNCVKLNKSSITKILNQQYGAQEMKIKSERFYYLGFSLGKIIDLGNGINTIYTLLQLFEEFEVYTRPGGSASLENNAILRVILPQNIESFSKLQDTSEKRYINHESFRESLNTAQDSLLDHKQPGPGNSGLLQNQISQIDEIKGSPQPRGHYEESKTDLKYKNPLPAYEQHYNVYEEYIMKTSAAGSQYSTENSIASRIHSTKVDPKLPNFKVLSCHLVPIQLDYCDVSSFLLDMLIIVYNKMYDNQFLNQQMLGHVEKIDAIIMNKVVKVLSDDVNRVAKILAVKQLAKINKALKIDFQGQIELNRVPSDDDMFDIAGLDLESNHHDAQLFNQAAVNLNGNSLRLGNQEQINTMGSSYKANNLNNQN